MKKSKDIKTESSLKRGIRFKLISMFIILITIPVLISGACFLFKGQQYFKRKFKRSTLETVIQTKQAIENYTTTFEQSAVQLSHRILMYNK